MSVLTYDDAVKFFAQVFRGEHHIGGIVKKHHEYDHVFSVCTGNMMSTWDSDYLTRLVFHAHDCGYRVEIYNGGPRNIKIVIWKRDQSSKTFMEGHPNLREAVEAWEQNVRPFERKEVAP